MKPSRDLSPSEQEDFAYAASAAPTKVRQARQVADNENDAREQGQHEVGDEELGLNFSVLIKELNPSPQLSEKPQESNPDLPFVMNEL